MRPGAEFPMSHGAPTAAPANGTAPHSAWQSPVPYLFGGLAAMLGLIAFALLILACSYWKLSGYLDAGSGSDRDEAGSGTNGDQKGSAAGAARPAAGFQEHVVVIMAGEERPTFLATPAASRAVVELGAATTSMPGSCGCSGSGEETKVADDDGATSQPRLEGDAASSRSNEESSSSSRRRRRTALGDDAASSRSNEESSSSRRRRTTALEGDAASSRSNEESSSSTALQESSQ